MTVNIAGIMGTVALCGLSFCLINAGGSVFQESIAAVKQGQIMTAKRRFLKKQNPTQFFISVAQELLWSVVLCVLAVAIIYGVFFSPFASALR